MKSFLTVAIFAFLATVLAAKTITYYKNGSGQLVTENLDEPVAETYAVDINKMKFMLYSPGQANPQELKSGDATGVKNSKFNPLIPTKVLIHGWQCSYTAESVQMLKDALQAAGNYNILIVDYEQYNSPYLTAVSNAKNIGAKVGEFLSFLLTQGLNIKDLHIIGHSLGAHISGFTANNIKAGKVPRITGLDPAGPMYENKGPADRLSSDDATYVDVMHTSTALGMDKSAGTADFFVNGGQGQPMCTQAAVPGACDHSTSYKYYCETIADKKRYPARTCDSETDAKANDKALSACSAKGAYMGEDAINTAPAGIYHV